jgi:antirestriction protein ArdC
MNVYEIITHKVMEQLEKGKVPWRRPWGLAAQPRNFITKLRYRGINRLLLSFAPVSSPYWLTFKQIQRAEGTLKKGTKGFPVVYFDWKERTLDNNDTERYPVLRYYRVFNADHIEGIAFPQPEARAHQPIAECERILTAMPNSPHIQYLLPHAYYVPGKDYINMPPKELFRSDEGYYATLFHELSHSTGHSSRLNRLKPDEGDCRFGTPSYAREELIAEMSSAFLCATAGIDNVTLENQSSYISGWLDVLRKDKRMVIAAAGQAQKAADYILGESVAERKEAEHVA